MNTQVCELDTRLRELDTQACELNSKDCERTTRDVKSTSESRRLIKLSTRRTIKINLLADKQTYLRFITSKTAKPVY